MVLGCNYPKKNINNNFALKYFNQLWEWWISSGGRSRGLKVFRGMVQYNRTFIYNYNFAYWIWNEAGVIQYFFKTLKMNFMSGITLYSGIGLLSINPVENSQDIGSILQHDTIFNKPYTWGNSLCLKNSKIGLVLFAIQSYKDKQAKLARSAGCYSKILKISDGKVFLQMPSLKIYVISELCSATLGLSSKRNLRKLTTAGQSIHIGRSPKVWGIAMNPVDHPHGGRTNKGCHPRTPTGLLAKGVKTRKMAKWSKRKVFTSRIRSLSA